MEIPQYVGINLLVEGSTIKKPQTVFQRNLMPDDARNAKAKTPKFYYQRRSHGNPGEPTPCWAATNTKALGPASPGKENKARETPLAGQVASSTSAMFKLPSKLKPEPRNRRVLMAHSVAATVAIPGDVLLRPAQLCAKSRSQKLATSLRESTNRPAKFSGVFLQVSGKSVRVPGRVMRAKVFVHEWHTIVLPPNFMPPFSSSCRSKPKTQEHVRSRIWSSMCNVPLPPSPAPLLGINLASTAQLNAIRASMIRRRRTSRDRAFW